MGGGFPGREAPGPQRGGGRRRPGGGPARAARAPEQDGPPRPRSRRPRAGPAPGAPAVRRDGLLESGSGHRPGRQGRDLVQGPDRALGIRLHGPGDHRGGHPGRPGDGRAGGPQGAIRRLPHAPRPGRGGSAEVLGPGPSRRGPGPGWRSPPGDLCRSESSRSTPDRSRSRPTGWTRSVRPFEVPDGDVVRLVVSARSGANSDELVAEVPIRPWGVQEIATASGTSSDDVVASVSLPQGRAHEGRRDGRGRRPDDRSA